MSQDRTGPTKGPEGAPRQEWTLDAPRVLDVGGEGERVASLRVVVVGGRVDVVTHDDSPTARVEVTSVTGLPVQVRWDGSTLSVTHGKDGDPNLLQMIRRTVESFSHNSVALSISVPASTDTSVSTVGAAALLSGLRGHVRANTVSGAMTLSDLQGDLDLNTVSGDVECDQLEGTLKVNAISGGVTVQASDLPCVRINTVSGDIALDLTTGTCDLSSNSVSGDITLRAPLQGFDVEATTASGQVVVDGTTVTGGGGHGRGRGGGQLRDGDGALRIRAHAVSGDLVVLSTTPRDTPSPADRSAPTPQDAPAGPAGPTGPPAGPTGPTGPATTWPTGPAGHPQDHPGGRGPDDPWSPHDPWRGSGREEWEAGFPKPGEPGEPV